MRRCVTLMGTQQCFSVTPKCITGKCPLGTSPLIQGKPQEINVHPWGCKPPILLSSPSSLGTVSWTSALKSLCILFVEHICIICVTTKIGSVLYQRRFEMNFFKLQINHKLIFANCTKMHCKLERSLFKGANNQPQKIFFYLYKYTETLSICRIHQKAL